MDVGLNKATATCHQCKSIFVKCSYSQDVYVKSRQEQSGWIILETGPSIDGTTVSALLTLVTNGPKNDHFCTRARKWARKTKGIAGISPLSANYPLKCWFDHRHPRIPSPYFISLNGPNWNVTIVSEIRVYLSRCWTRRKRSYAIFFEERSPETKDHLFLMANQVWWQ